MNEALKTLEALTQTLYAEINRLAMDNSISDRAYIELRKAALDAIKLKEQIETARAWNVKDATLA